MKKVDAFVTVEYALLLPVLFLIYAVLIYIGIYQYNACLLQNDVYFCAMEEASTAYANKYMLMEEVGVEVHQKANQLSIVGKGKMGTPFVVWGVADEFWSLEHTLEVQKHSPQNILRICKGLKNES